MKNFSKIVLALFLGVWTSNLAASELNSFAENTDAYVLNDCSFEEELLPTDVLYFVKIHLEGSITLHGCTMTYDITVSYNIIKNDKATNTVENFKYFIDSSKENLLEELIFVTSKFHRNRAHLIWNNLNERDINNKWILEENSEIEHPWLIEEEKVHIKNINSDLSKII